MSKKFVNKLLTIAMMSICSTVVNASDNSVPLIKLRDNFVINKVNNFNVIDNVSNNSTSDSDKNSKNNSPKIKKQDTLSEVNNNQIEEIDLYNMKNNCKTNSKNTINENKKVKYEPDKMWFDYQALFDNTKNAMLKEPERRYVDHIDFNQNECARKATFESCEYNSDFIDSVLNGNIVSQYFIFNNLYRYLAGGHKIKEMDNRCVIDKHLNNVNLNYKCFLGILLLLGKHKDGTMNKYVEITGQSDIKKKNLSNITYYDVMEPLIHECNTVNI